MQKRFICLLLSAVLIMVSAVSACGESSESRISFLSAVQSGTVLRVTYRVEQAVEEQQVTYLVYRQTAKGTRGDAVQAGQLSVTGNGVHQMVIPVALWEYGYQICLGATQTTADRFICLTAPFTAGGLFITKGQTVQQLTALLSPMTQVTVDRKGTVLGQTKTVKQGDAVTALSDEITYRFWAVIPGDVDLNGTVEATDALQILRHTVGKETLQDAALAAADFTQSGQVGAVQALQILRHTVGKVTAL